MTNTTLLVDGNNIAYRSFHKLSLSTPGGADVGVVYGFLKSLQKYCNRFKPSRIIVCWDGGIPEYRRQYVPSYKANRVKDESFETVFSQMDLLHNSFLPVCGVLSVKRIGIEADDLMYHAASCLKNDECIIISSDKDMYQALRMDNVSVYNPNTDTLVDVEQIEEEYGIPIIDYVSFRALVGDSSDNISGAVGIGTVTAKKLFAEFNTVTAMLNAAESENLPHKGMTNAVAAKLAKFGFSNYRNNFYIMMLHFDRCGARHTLMNTSYNEFDRKQLVKLLKEYSFHSLLEHDFFKNWMKLQQPIFDKDTRYPLIYSRKRYYE